MEINTKKKNTLKIIGNVAFWVVLLSVVFYSALSLFSSHDSNMTSVFGTSTLSVLSDSMSPTFKKGDLFYVDTTFNVDDLEVGDVITYTMFLEIDGTTVTVFNSHRIDTINEVGGVKWFYTKGDNNLTADTSPIVGSAIKGVWTGSKIVGLGGVVNGLVKFLKSTLGFFLFIVLPCFGFLVYEIVRFVKIVSEYNVQKALGDRVQMQEEALAMARAQLESEFKAKNETGIKKE